MQVKQFVFLNQFSGDPPVRGSPVLRAPYGKLIEWQCIASFPKHMNDIRKRSFARIGWVPERGLYPDQGRRAWHAWHDAKKGCAGIFPGTRSARAVARTSPAVRLAPPSFILISTAPGKTSFLNCPPIGVF